MTVILVSHSKKRGYTAQDIHNVKSLEHVKEDICKAVRYDGSEYHFRTSALVNIHTIKDEAEEAADD